jgi:hypothetical protein
MNVANENINEGKRMYNIDDVEGNFKREEQEFINSLNSFERMLDDHTSYLILLFCTSSFAICIGLLIGSKL